MHLFSFVEFIHNFYVMCKGGHCLVTLQAYTCDVGWGSRTVLEIIRFFLFKRGWDVRGTTLYGHDLHTIICKQEYIWFRGGDLSSFWDILQHFLFKGGGDQNVPSSLAYHQMLLNTRNKNIYGVGISMALKIFDHFVYQEGQDHFIWSWPTI